MRGTCVVHLTERCQVLAPFAGQITAKICWFLRGGRVVLLVSRPRRGLVYKVVLLYLLSVEVSREGLETQGTPEAIPSVGALNVPLNG